MHTKALARAARALVAAGTATLRFNFRGVGQSAGAFSGGDGERDDARCALHSLLDTIGPLPVLLGGFSFGSHVALQLGCSTAAPPTLRGLVGIAPPLQLFDFSFLETCHWPLLLVLGDDDPVCPLPDLRALHERLPASTRLEILRGAGHLLLERLDALETALQQFVEATLQRPPEPT